MQDSKIEWCHHTNNLWTGCCKVHEGCDNCYAEVLSHRWGNDVWGIDKPRKEVKSAFDNLKKFQTLAKQAGEYHRVFVGSMMDIFERSQHMINSKGEEVSLTTQVVRSEFLNAIAAGHYPNLIFLLLTKRPSNINKMIPDTWKFDAPVNVMFGTSCSTQKNLDTLLPQLQQVNGYRFLSIEPQIEKIILPENIKVDWIIQGGESGHHKRPFKLDWAYSMKEQCKELGIPYFFKQIDKVKQIPDDLMIREFATLECEAA